MLDRSRNQGCLSDLRIDLFLAGELEPAATAAAGEHLRACHLCAARQAELERDRVGYRAAARPPLSPTPSRTAVAPARPRALSLSPRWLWPAAAAAAAIALFLLWPRGIVDHPSDQPPDDSGSAPTSAGTRLKGGPALGFYIKRGDGVHAGASGEEVRPGDGVRFTNTSAEAAFLVVASVDAAGRVSVYHPSGAHAEPIAPGTDRPLPTAVVLDDAPGTERVVGFFCRSAIDVSTARDALAQAQANRGDPKLPGCRIDQLRLEKRAR